LLVIVGSALWGTDALFRRPLTGFLSPVTIVLLEHIVLLLVMFPAIVRNRREFKSLGVRDYSLLLIIALGGSVAATSLFTFAIKYGNPSVIILLQKTQPLFTVLLARLFLKERPAKWFWPWFAAAIGGAYLISNPQLDPGSAAHPGHPAILLSAIGAAALWGSATVCGRHMVSRVTTPFLTGLRFLFALPALLILYWLQPVSGQTLPKTLTSASTVIAMALIAGLAALLLYYQGLRSTSASVASVCELSFPITAVALNWLVLGARLSAVQLCGSAILITSVTIMVSRNAREQKLPPAGDAKLIRP
jgi:drug/metabolite transporter (DMT)-like permease